jgi:WD40 repeat protein
VWSVAFSPDGKRILTGSTDKTAKLWDTATGWEILTLKGHTDGVRGVAFSPNGRRIVTSSDDGTARVWEGASDEEAARWAKGE